MNTPNDCPDDILHELWEGGAVSLNAETLLGNKPLAIIDLQRRYKIVVTQNPNVHPSQRFEAIDEITFDPDPDSTFNIIGRGPTDCAAICELLQGIASVVAQS